VDLPVPRLSYEDLRLSADKTLAQHHPSNQIPIPVEQILEFAFDVSIIPLPGLQIMYEIDAFTSKDCHRVYVDHSVMEHRSPNRYRYSLAHELGHIILHQEVFAAVSFSSATEWKQAMLAMSEPHRERLEFQAYDFAGLLLVPRTALKTQLSRAVDLATDAGFSICKESDVAKEYVAWTSVRSLVPSYSEAT
jgi:hypothetical protein